MNTLRSEASCLPPKRAASATGIPGDSPSRSPAGGEEVLVGTWEMSGEAQGQMTYEWLEGRFFLIQHIDLEQYGQKTRGIEIIGHEGVTALGLQHVVFAGTFPAALTFAAGFFMWGLGAGVIAHRQGRLLPLIVAHFISNLFGLVLLFFMAGGG